MSDAPGADLPTLVSFAAGDEYYFRRARRLRDSCERLGIPHSIEFRDDLGDLGWSQLCRYKVRFFQRKLAELDRPVLWVDADTHLLAVPHVLAGQSVDFAAFPQAARLSRFDGYTLTRMWRPGMLYFGNTPAARGFLQHMVDLEATSPENVTDAYLLQEAWATYPVDMDVLALSPRHIARTPAETNDDTWIIDGHSGNVEKFREKVVQHGTILHRGELLTEMAADHMRRGEHAVAETLLRTAQDYGWDSAVHTRRLAQVVRARGRGTESDDLIRRFADDHPESGEAQVMGARLALRQRRFDDAAAMLDRATRAGGTAAAQAASLRLDLNLERRADAAGLTARQRPAVWWMKQPYPGNLGDVLTPYVVERLAGVPPRFVPQSRGMLAIGSIVKFAGDGSDVWGSGTPRMTDTLNPRARYHAVRGPLTRELVLRSGGEAPEVYGDPALLMPRFYAPDVRKRYRLGVVRHVSDRGLGRLAPGVRDLDLLRVGYDEMERFVDELLECEHVISTSLHGLVLAGAYGIPARWAFFSDAPKPIAGDGTKFLDYFRSVGIPDQTPLDLADLEVLDETLVQHVDPRSAELDFDPDRLIEAFPWEAP